MTERKFSPGFRLSTLDVVVLVIGGAGAAYAISAYLWFGLAIAFVIAHFFLFCNVLRMSRSLELVWAGVFAVLAIAATTFGLLSWTMVFVLSAGVTLVLAVAEMRKPSYHGVGWQTLNPRLPEWWRAAVDDN